MPPAVQSRSTFSFVARSVCPMQRLYEKSSYPSVLILNDLNG
eukprot:SAG11_NODE_10982_length_791_cov_11.423410_3_plen_41_part_01